MLSKINICILILMLCGKISAATVTENSYKYVGNEGKIYFVSSYSAVPDEYKKHKHMSRYIEQECDSHLQKLLLIDLNDDGDSEIIVNIKSYFPNGRIFNAFEIFKRTKKNIFYYWRGLAEI